MNRPEIVQGDHLEYLDDLREEGVVNMVGAGTYLEMDWGLTKAEAREVLKYWMETFGNKKR